MTYIYVYVIIGTTLSVSVDALFRSLGETHKVALDTRTGRVYNHDVASLRDLGPNGPEVMTFTVPDRELGATARAPGGTSGTRSIMLKVEDGKLKLPARDETRDNLRRLIGASGLMEGDETAGAFELSDQAIAGLYSALGSIEAVIASGITKIPFAKTSEIFAYSETDLRVLKEPTAVVARKYGGSLVKYADEINLVFCLVRVHVLKLMLLRTVKAQMDAKPATEKVTEGSAYGEAPN